MDGHSLIESGSVVLVDLMKLRQALRLQGFSADTRRHADTPRDRASLPQDNLSVVG